MLKDKKKLEEEWFYNYVQLNSEWIYGGHRFSQNANQKLQGFLPYQTNKSTFFDDFLENVGIFLDKILVCLVGQKSL